MAYRWPAGTAFTRIVLDVEDRSCVLFVTVPCTCATTAIIISGRWRGHAGGEPSGALSSIPWCESRDKTSSPATRIVYQHAPLVYGLGCVVLAWPAPLCPSLVGASASSRVTGWPPDHIVPTMPSRTTWACTEPMLAARQQDPERLADDYREYIAGLVLTIDGLQPEKGHETLYVVRRS